MRKGIAVAAAAMTALGLLGASPVAQAQTRPAPHVTIVHLHQSYERTLRHHPDRHLKISGTVYPRGFRPATARRARASCTEPTCPLVTGGGPVQHNPRVYLLLWGPNWTSDPAQQASASYLANFYQGLGTGPQDTWSAIAAQYGDPTGFPSFAGSVFAGVFQDPATPPKGATPQDIAAEADAFAVSQPIDDALGAQVVVATQSGTCPQGFAAAACGTTSQPYCAWHSVSQEPFINLPYLPDAGVGCGANFVNSGASGADDGFSLVGGEEYAGTITDPVPPLGWVDTSDTVSGGEIGDKCAWGGREWNGNDPVGNLTLSTGTFAMESLWSNAANACVMAAPATDTVTVTNPGSQTTGPDTFTTLTMTATSSQGHPLIIWKEKGLPPGLSINPATGVISGRTTTAGTYPATITAKDSSDVLGTVSFTWTVTSTDVVTISNPGAQNSAVGAPVSLQLHGQSDGGFALTWSAQGLPPGLSVNSTTGLITGAPTTDGSYPVTVTGTDYRSVTGSASFTWTITGTAGKPIVGDGGVCLDDNSSKTVNGNKIDIWKCNSTPAQQWTLNSNGTLSVLGMCLADHGYTGAGTKLVLWACVGNRNERWTHESNGEYVLAFGGLCLTDPSASTADGTQVEIRTCNGFKDQQWTGP